MSTDFLNRRMDLSHSLATRVGDTPSKSILTMDTSYPVKLAGKVIKLFTAADRYYKNMTWEIRNSIDELILTIATDHVYDFAGNVLNDSVGEGLPYGTESEVYAEGDYIMAVIDFDAAILHLCSETNFKNYFHGEKGGKLKLFEIDGKDDISSDTSNFPYTAISKEEFAKAVAFENDNNETHSFMRHSDDQVLWELPEQETEENITNREMIPVAKVDNFNINGLNISISILMFPSINASNRYRGMENLQEFNAYYTIEGEVNEEFIEKFCFEYDELKKDPITHHYNLEILEYGGYLGRYLSTIPDTERSNYRYVFLRNIDIGTFNACKRQKAPFSETKLVDDYWIIPIDKTTNKFKAYFYKPFSGALVKNEAMTLRSMVADTRFLIGSYWKEDFNGFGILHYSGNYSKIFRIFDGKEVYKNSTNQYIYKSFNETNRSLENSACLARYKTDQTAQQWYNIDSMKYVKRFISFFGNADNTYMNHFREYTLSAPNNTFDNVGFGYVKNGSFTYQPIPVIVSMNPKLFEKLLYGQNPDSYSPSNVRESCTLRNFCDINDSTVTTPDPSFDRTEYKFDSRVSIWGDTNVRYFRSVIYEVFDRLDNDLKFEYKLYDRPSSEYNFGCNIKSVHYPFVCRANQSPINNSHDSILVQDTNDKNHMLTFVNCIALATINTPYYDETEPEYNNAELAYESILVDHVIEFAKGTDSNSDHIIIENNKIYIKPNTNEAARYQLFTIIDTNTSNPNNTFEFRELTPSNFKNSTSHTNGLDYYYYDKDGEIRRIKYFYNEADPKSSVALYDYYVDSKLFSKSDTIPTDGTFYDFNQHDFIKAYIGAYIADFNQTYQQAIASWNSNLQNNWKDLILKTIKHYKFFPYNLTSEDNRMVYEKFTNNLNNEFRSNTCDLTDRFDYTLLCALTPNETSLHEGHGALLSDFVKGYALHEDCRAPYVSNTEVNGSKIYNVASYINYLKHKPIDDIFDVDSFKYLNGAGIRKEYYYDDKNKKYRSLYQFYQYCMSRNLEYPIGDSKSIRKSDSLSMATAIYDSDSIKKIKRNQNDNSSKFYELDGSTYKPYTLKSKLLAYMPVDSQNVFGYNQITLYNDDNDFSIVNSVYESDNVLYISKIQTGVYTIFDISMNDGNPINSSILNVNGVLGSIEVDTVNWSTLLLALNNNKTIDLLSTSLITIKNQLNTYILGNTQNINSSISTAENNAVEANANSHDNIYDRDSELYKETNAVYDSTHDIYIFNYGYGFKYPETPITGVSQERVINNRGVIVFETDGFKTYQYRNNSAGERPEDYWYKTVEGTIYPKRMYISRDGLVCTKQLIEKEEEWGMSLLQKLGIN